MAHSFVNIILTSSQIEITTLTQSPTLILYILGYVSTIYTKWQTIRRCDQKLNPLLRWNNFDPAGFSGGFFVLGGIESDWGRGVVVRAERTVIFGGVASFRAGTPPPLPPKRASRKPWSVDPLLCNTNWIKIVNQLNFDPGLCNGKWIIPRISSLFIWSKAWSCVMPPAGPWEQLHGIQVY